MTTVFDYEAAQAIEVDFDGESPGCLIIPDSREVFGPLFHDQKEAAMFLEWACKRVRPTTGVTPSDVLADLDKYRSSIDKEKVALFLGDLTITAQYASVTHKSSLEEPMKWFLDNDPNFKQMCEAEYFYGGTLVRGIWTPLLIDYIWEHCELPWKAAGQYAMITGPEGIFERAAFDEEEQFYWQVADLCIYSGYEMLDVYANHEPYWDSLCEWVQQEADPHPFTESMYEDMRTEMPTPTVRQPGVKT